MCTIISIFGINIAGEVGNEERDNMFVTFVVSGGAVLRDGPQRGIAPKAVIFAKVFSSRASKFLKRAFIFRIVSILGVDIL